MLEIVESRREVISAECDKCGQDLMENQDGNANFGQLKGNFGWPSPLDHLGWDTPECETFHLCALCWMNCLESLGLLKNSEQLIHTMVEELALKQDRAIHLKY